MYNIDFKATNKLSCFLMPSFIFSSKNEQLFFFWLSYFCAVNLSYSHLFNGNLSQRIEDTINNKLMWKSSVWSARDNGITIGPLRSHNRTIVNLYERWKRKMPSQIKI
jgi:hypothetical protein